MVGVLLQVPFPEVLAFLLRLLLYAVWFDPIGGQDWYLHLSSVMFPPKSGQECAGFANFPPGLRSVDVGW